MIEHPHINQVQRLLQTLGQQLIRLTGIAVTGRVVVTKDHRRRVQLQSTPHHLTRIDRDMIDRADCKALIRYEPVLAVEVEDMKAFDVIRRAAEILTAEKAS